MVGDGLLGDRQTQKGLQRKLFLLRGLRLTKNKEFSDRAPESFDKGARLCYNTDKGDETEETRPQVSL